MREDEKKPEDEVDEEPLSEYFFLDELGIEYFDGKKKRHSVWTDLRVKALADSLLEWVQKSAEKIQEGEFSHTDFLFKSWMYANNVSHVALCRLKKRDLRFKAAVEIAKDFEEYALSICGLYSKQHGTDPGFVKFFLSCVHKWKEPTTENESQDNVGKVLQDFNSSLRFLRSKLDD